MFLQLVVTFLVLAPIIFAYHIELSELIKKVLNESDSTPSVIFIGIFRDGFLDKYLAENFNTPVSLFTHNPDSNDGINEQMYTDVILVVDAHSTTMQSENLISRILARKSVIVASENVSSLEKNFIFFAKNKFIGIHGVAGADPYTYLPYAASPLQKISIQEKIPNSLVDLNGFTFRVGVQFDTPRVFWYEDKHQQRKIAGYAGELFNCFLKKHNATMEAIYSKNFHTTFILDPIINNSMDIKMVGWGGDERVAMSYPLTRAGWTIIIPINCYLDSRQYFLRPFSLEVWMCVGLTFVYIILMDLLKDIWTNRPTTVWHCFSRTLLRLLDMPLDGPVNHAYRFHFQVILFAFILVNFYVVYLTSFLTVFIKVKQFDTLRELIDNNVPLMVSEFGWNTMHESLPYTGIDKILKIFDDATVLQTRKSLTNTEYGFAIDIDIAAFYIDLKARYAKDQFHAISENFFEHDVAFLLGKESPFLGILNQCIIQSMAGGLFGKWTSEASAIVRQNDEAYKLPSPTKTRAPLTMNHLRFAWAALFSGLAVAAIVFLSEKYGRVVVSKIRVRNYTFEDEK